ncbi:MAG: MtrB/PioB family decaheme-associated outer membrane protein [Thiobacillus sp.]|nr:MtrB/PioB family decaheme-associated outer membrane protein [Thiobacillus sp.]
MKIHNRKMQVSVLGLAVQCALAAMFALPMMAQAADATEADDANMRRPSNYVEVGAGYVSEDSAKFGEYNGLNDSGPYLIGNFSVRGGDSYEGGDGTLRWGITGTDLGTTSRELGATVGHQGQWHLNIGYDELRHNISDTYQTPQQGSMGGNTFTFPADFGTINGQSNPSARVLNATQLGAFHTTDVHTDRKNTSFGAGYIFSPKLSLKFDYNHLDQDGAKLLGVGALGAPATTGTWRAEAVNIIMNPTNYKTDTFNLALNWVGDKGHLTGSYFGSIFRDGYDSVSAQNAMLSNTSTAAPGLYQTNTMSTAPDNSLHQLNLTGGYAFSSATKLSGGLSYGRNTQDNSYLSGMPEIFSAPRSSLDGKVITTHADLKLTHQATQDLALSAGLKYNERENKSPSNMYQFWAINGVSTNLANVDYAANAPYSNRKTQFELAGDYRLSKGQNVRLAYEHESIKRWCDNYAIAGANCLVNPGNDEDKLGVTYRLKALDNVNFNAGYTFSKRGADFEGNAITPLAGLNTPNPDDVNALNYPGYIAYPYAKRDQHLVKAGVNWQASEKLDLGLNGRYARDDYNATLGVQDGHTASVNLDATYAYSENGSVSAYASWMNRERNLKAGAAGAGAVNEATSYALLVAPANIWTNQLEEDGNAIGLNTKHKLMGGKLEIVGDVSYSLDKSHYSTQVPYVANCGTPAVLTCGSTPDIKNELITLKLTGTYALDKSAKVGVGYLYQQLNSNDYYYNAYQYGYTPNRVMPTNEQAPSYEVHVVAVSYIYNFK